MRIKRTSKKLEIIYKDIGKEKFISVVQDKNLNVSDKFKYYNEHCSEETIKLLKLRLQSFRYMLEKNLDVGSVFKDIYSIPREEKLSFLYSFISRESIVYMLRDLNYSHKMIYELLKRDFPEYFESKYAVQNNSPFRALLTSDIKVPFDSEKYNAIPAHIRWQYKFPKDTPVDIIKQKIKKDAQIGQNKTSSLRKERGVYNPRQGVDYWIKNGFSQQGAEEQVQFYKKSNSPYCVEFYLKKGIKEDVAKDIISSMAAKRALASLKKTQNSSLEKITEQILIKNEIKYIRQFPVPLRDNEKTYRKKKYVYDFLLYEHGLIINCNGTYWHADSRVFKENDIIKYPAGITSAKDVWGLDNHRKETAISRGYKFLELWEIDLKRDNKFFEEKILLETNTLKNKKD